MLAQLSIRNLAVIDEVELDFAPGLTVLTGETGAGKSILVDALALALGERADSRAIRGGSARCEITAVFDVGRRPALLAWLRENDLDEDNDCILRRIVGADGRSRGYVNGRGAPMQTLREIGERLVDICGQQSHQSLRHAPVQREILDHFGGHEPLLRDVEAAHRAWSAAQSELQSLREAHSDRDSRLDLLRHETSELEALNPRPGEFAELERAHRLAANVGRIAADVTRALEQTYESDGSSAHAMLSGARRALDDLVGVDAELTTATGLLGEAEILVAEAADAMRQRLGRLEHEPAEQARIEQRLAGFHELARKHRVEPDALPDRLRQLDAELTNLETGDQRLGELTARAEACRSHLAELAASLSRARETAGADLAEQVTDHMHTLGMPDGRFTVDLQAAPGDAPGVTGADRVEFVVTANPGQPAGPLARVASGGELSRISLSLQVVAMAVDALPTLIFDEVDAGIGGGVAEIVGGRLRDLAADRQVLCVTHLPQVASQAIHHLRVAKISDGRATRTTVSPLSPPARVEEIARMLGGVEITASTRAHAEEMLGAGGTRKAG
ncbi:MAG: DNA repair protein RecN [Gammaproteobacteria bacterium]